MVSWSTRTSGRPRLRSHSIAGASNLPVNTRVASIGTSRAGIHPPASSVVSKARDSPDPTKPSATAPRNAVVTSSANTFRSMVLNSTPTTPVEPRASARAAGSGPTYPRSSATASIRSRSSGDNLPGREKALDTVIRLTPTASAIVCSVTRLIPIGSLAPAHR